jgi:hypothetical protein
MSKSQSSESLTFQKRLGNSKYLIVHSAYLQFLRFTVKHSDWFLRTDILIKTKKATFSKTEIPVVATFITMTIGMSFLIRHVTTDLQCHLLYRQIPLIRVCSQMAIKTVIHLEVLIIIQWVPVQNGLDWI